MSCCVSFLSSCFINSCCSTSLSSCCLSGCSSCVKKPDDLLNLAINSYGDAEVVEFHRCHGDKESLFNSPAKVRLIYGLFNKALGQLNAEDKYNFCMKILNSKAIRSYQCGELFVQHFKKPCTFRYYAGELYSEEIPRPFTDELKGLSTMLLQFLAGQFQSLSKSNAQAPLEADKLKSVISLRKQKKAETKKNIEEYHEKQLKEHQAEVDQKKKEQSEHQAAMNWLAGAQYRRELAEKEKERELWKSNPELAEMREMHAQKMQQMQDLKIAVDRATDAIRYG